MSDILSFVSFSARWHPNPNFYLKRFDSEEDEQSLFTLDCAGINRGTESWNFLAPEANCHRIYYNLDLGSSVRIKERVVSLTPENVVFIPADVAYEARTRVPVRHCFIEFSQSPFSERLKEVRELPAQPVYAKLFRDLHDAVASENESATRCLALAIIHLVAVDLDVRCHVLPVELADVLKAIPRNNFRDTNASLARRLGFGVDRFSRWFQSYLKVSPAQYVREAQITEAARLLRSSERSIEEIAEACGFPNRFYLSRVFAQANGMGPGEYRKKAVASSAGSSGSGAASLQGVNGFVPAEVSENRWETLSLAALMNRRWKGPEAWFGGIPLTLHGGKRNIAGVPFQLPENTRGNQAVLLHSKRIPKSGRVPLPMEVAVPVGKKVEAAYIFHSCGWVTKSAHVADYLFKFSDGTEVAVPMVTAVNQVDAIEEPNSPATIADWFAHHPPLNNRQCAPFVISSAVQDHEVVLYVFKWVNPRPRTTLREIILRSRLDTEVPLAILGISLLLPEKGSKVEGVKKRSKK